MHGTFTPIESGFGGLLVGLSAASVLVVHGRVAGISGIFSGMRTARGEDFAWRALFIAGLAAGAFLNGALNPRAELPTLPAHRVGRYVAAGLLVGAGTKLGNGCTSGHGARCSRVCHALCCAHATCGRHLRPGAWLGAVARCRSHLYGRRGYHNHGAQHRATAI